MKAFYANLVADLILYRRNRLIALVAIFMGIIWGTMLIPSFLFMSVRDKFQIIQMLVEQSQWFVLIFVGALAVMTLSYNFNQRCFKMVITKPCPVEVWLAAHLAALLLVSAILHLILLGTALILFEIWHIPLQGGVFYLVCESFVRVALVVSVVTFLISVMHPFLAVVLMLLAHEDTFLNLLTWISAAEVEATKFWAKVGYIVAEGVVYGLYLIVPSYSLMSDVAANVHRTWRMGWGDIPPLVWGVLYALIAGICFFALSALALRRRRHT